VEQLVMLLAHNRSFLRDT